MRCSGTKTLSTTMSLLPVPARPETCQVSSTFALVPSSGTTAKIGSRAFAVLRRQDGEQHRPAAEIDAAREFPPAGEIDPARRALGLHLDRREGGGEEGR